MAPAASPETNLVPAPSASPAVADDPLAWLTEPERYAYDHFQANRGRGTIPANFPVAPTVQEGMFTLFLQGRTLGEIRQLNHPRFSLGQIVAAAVDGRWDEHRRVYLQELLTRTRTRALQAQAEGADFIADAMAAAHKLHGTALRKYLQSGDEKDLGDFAIGGITNYRVLAELFLKLTGQDQVKRVAVSGNVEHTGTVSHQIPVQRPALAAPADALRGWADQSRAKIARRREE